MSHETIIELLDKISCEFVLSDPQKPESLSGLLPILKRIHSLCLEMSLKSEAATVKEAKDMINSLIKKGLKGHDQQILNLERKIAEFSTAIYKAEPEKQPAGSSVNSPDEQPAKDFEELEEELNEISRLIGVFCVGEVPDLGAMLNHLDALMAVSKDIKPDTFYRIAQACNDYAQNMTLENMGNTKPIEEGLVLLKSILSHLKRNDPFIFDYSDVLELLEAELTKEQQPAAVKNAPAQEPAAESRPVPEKVSDDDMEILLDFISEAEDNLDAIEVSLIDLEQDPSNKDIINDIFRPFHTIKGVSGFLSLTKINKLAHTTENLLDSARSGEFVINQTATDAILESVDTLKTLIRRLKKGVRAGFMQPDDDIPVDSLRDKLRRLQVSLTKGEKEPLGEILIKQNILDEETLEQALEIQKTNPDKKIGQILIDEKKVAPKQIASALMDQTHVKKTVDAQVKVSTRKLDDLVDYAGELVIAQSMLRQRTSGDPSLAQTVTQLGQIVNNMQNIAMSMRMIPIKATFMKMIRLVRDLSRKSGKDVALTMVGEETEIDRNVVDALYEPMVHMIRNSVDHGIERAEDRAGAGKPSRGNICLRAYHKGGNIVIEIEDDGKGLDKERILEKAVSMGLITGGEQMTDAQVYDLIMQPGFSTARKVTDVSGRGVGMDVVKEGIEKFRGHLNVDSEKGKGTRFTISLPLTLAIIDGMLVRVDDEKYVIPTITIQKAFKPEENEYFTVEGKGEMVMDRGSLIPLIRLDEVYGSKEQKKNIQDCLVVVVESKDEKRALLIDELLGKGEYVIKSLGGNMEDIEGIAGGAILADGRVGLILDIHGIFSIVSNG